MGAVESAAQAAGDIACSGVAVESGGQVELDLSHKRIGTSGGVQGVGELGGAEGNTENRNGGQRGAYFSPVGQAREACKGCERWNGAHFSPFLR